MKVKTITIDLWGTLLFDGPASDNRYKKRRLADFEPLLAAAGMPVSAAALDRAYDESGSYLSRIWATHRDVPVDDHVRAILAAVDPGLPRRVPPAMMTALVDAYARPILIVPPAVDDGALAALETLNGGGYTLALVSNIMRTPGATLRRLLKAGPGDLPADAACGRRRARNRGARRRRPDPGCAGRPGRRDARDSGNPVGQGARRATPRPRHLAARRAARSHRAARVVITPRTAGGYSA